MTGALVPNFKATVRSSPVWTPGGAPSSQAVEEGSTPAQQELPTPPVWQPPHSPTTERKEFRPLHVSFISKNKGEPKKEPPLKSDVQPEESFAWKSEEKKHEAKEKISGSLDRKTTHSLPSPQSPTVTLLQKARAGELTRGAVYIDHKMNETETLPIPTPEYTVKSEHESEDEQGRKIIKLSPKKYEGIGPTTRYGLPLGLRSVVKEENQGEWYKKMYNSLHRSANQGASGSGYMSEPEPELHSEYNRYATLDRRRLRNRHNQYEPASARYDSDLYKNEPRSIEVYEPGKSSLAEHESKKWWEDLQTTFDSFDSWLHKKQLVQRNDQIGLKIKYGSRHNPPLQKTPLHYSGYESDSTLVYRKREEQKSVQPEEQKAWYLNIQKGGEVPLSGLRKPAPEKPEAPTHEYIEDSVNIHYRSPCRRLAKEEIPEDELRMRQERHMRQLYEEQKRRKLLQELDDMDRRRHTDNLLPKQKSPIPLNRYDDLFDEPPKIKLKERTPEPKVCARAVYSFLPQNARELGFTKGDIIFIRRQLDKNWYEGEHNAMIGIFPVSYVEIIPYDGIRTMPRKPTHGQGRAKFTFIAQSPAELSLVKGESILLTRRIDENWYEGRIGNRTGIFPVSYVEVITEPSPKSSSVKPMGTPVAHSLIMNGSTPSQSGKQVADLSIEVRGQPVKYRALYNYRPQNEDELELNEGDIVMVVEKCDDGWYVGTSDASGLFGTFPGNYVVRI